MTKNEPGVEAVALPSAALFCDGHVPEPLTEEQRQWLVEQLHAYPRRVNEARTCCIGALTDMATTEFCRLMAEHASLPQDKRIARTDEILAKYESGEMDAAGTIEDLVERIAVLEEAREALRANIVGSELLARHYKIDLCNDVENGSAYHKAKRALAKIDAALNGGSNDQR